MPRPAWTSAAVILAALLAAPPALHGDEPVAPSPATADLARLAPSISHTDADLQKVDLGVTFDMPVYGVSFRLRLLATARDRAAVYIVDPADSTPLMATVDGVTLVYDPQSSSVLYVHTTRPSFDLLYQNGTVRWNFGFGQKDAAAGGEPWKLAVNAASFMEAAKVNRTVRALDGGAYELAGTTDKDARVVARLAPARPSPLVSLQYFPPQSDKPTMVIDSLLINNEVGETIRALPTHEELSREFANVVDLDWTDAANDAERDKKRTLVLERLFRALIFRNAIHHEALRPAAEQNFGNIDWTAYEKRDRLNAEKLKRLIVVPGINAAG